MPGYKSHNPPPSHRQQSRIFLEKLLQKRQPLTREEILDAASEDGMNRTTVEETLDGMAKSHDVVTEHASGGMEVYRLG